ncbi:MAG: AMP-binding protein [Solirubrobacteraceae bacterium]
MGQRADTAMARSIAGANQNLSHLLTQAALAQPDACVLLYEQNELTYAELERRSQQAAALLRELGITAGDHVGLQMPNVPAFISLYFGILRLGAVVVPQNPLSGRRELEQNMADAQVKLVFAQPLTDEPMGDLECGARVVRVTTDDGLELFRDCEPLTDTAHVPGDATAVILYTSGTTGQAKGAELTHSNLGLNALAAIEIYSLVPEDVVLATLPLYHSYGQTCTLNGAIAVQARLVLTRRFDATRVARLIDQHSVTVFLGVPTMFSDIAHVPPDAASLRSLRLCGAGGAALPPEVRRQFEDRSGAPLYETYGLSETSPIASINRRGRSRRIGTIGWPIVGTEMRIADTTGRTLPPGEVGEIAIRGHNVMKGYWANPEATNTAIDADGWFYSGDLGTMDGDGCFMVVGRLKDLIIRGGSNVYPAEVEHVLDTHPAVRLAAVVGVADERLGEEVGAAVWLEPGVELSTDELRDWARLRLAAQKSPRHIWFVDELPLGPTGKILKRLIVPPEDFGEPAEVPMAGG